MARRARVPGRRRRPHDAAVHRPGHECRRGATPSTWRGSSTRCWPIRLRRAARHVPERAPAACAQHDPHGRGDEGLRVHGQPGQGVAAQRADADCARDPRPAVLPARGHLRPQPSYANGSYFGLPRSLWRRAAGRLLPQPCVKGPDGREQRLDDLLGTGFALVGIGIDPRRSMTADDLAPGSGSRRAS